MISTSLFSLPRPLAANPPRLDCINRESLFVYFHDSWSLYEQLFETIAHPGAFIRQPDPLRLPLAFYLGHTASFFVNKLRLAGVLNCGVHPEWDELFARGVDPAHAGEIKKIEWPAVEALWKYRSEVHSVIQDVIDSIDYGAANSTSHPSFSHSQGSAVWALMMGIEHERLHWETSSVLLRQAPTEIFNSESPWKLAPLNLEGDRNVCECASQMVEVPATLVKIGKETCDPVFGWDNEYGCLEREVSAFEISRDLVTNREFAEFVYDGGYDLAWCWSASGWEWKLATKSCHPKFWTQTKGSVRYRTTFSEIDLPDSWPVEVNHYEAEAYCRWRGGGYRLPTELEYRSLTQCSLQSATLDEVVGWQQPYNIHLRFGSPTPVGLSQTADIVNDLRGNVWQLLADDFYPLPGFRADQLYPDFSSPYFGPDHGMMAGGSWATTGTAASIHYRLWFRRFFFQHAGFRLARGLCVD